MNFLCILNTNTEKGSSKLGGHNTGTSIVTDTGRKKCTSFVTHYYLEYWNSIFDSVWTPPLGNTIFNPDDPYYIVE